jgi:hypothetical protein
MNKGCLEKLIENILTNIKSVISFYLESLNIIIQPNFSYNKWLFSYTHTAHWSRFPDFVQQLFFSHFLPDFDAQYSKLGVFGSMNSFLENIGRIWAI